MKLVLRLFATFHGFIAFLFVCAALPDTLELYRAIEAGAVGYLLKADMRTETLASSLRAIACGDGVIPPAMLGDLVEHIGRMSREVWTPRGVGLSGLSLDWLSLSLFNFGWFRPLRFQLRFLRSDWPVWAREKRIGARGAFHLARR